MRQSSIRRAVRAAFLIALIAGSVTACGAAASSASPAGAPSSIPSIEPAASESTAAAASSEGPSASAMASDQAPEESGSTAAGDIPDNAVFLRFRGGTPPFSIHYVEGWQVTSQPDGVVIRDKDSSETVAIVAPTDPHGYVSSTDLPALQGQPGFKLVRQDTVKVGTSSYVRLVFHLPAPPDPVTGKQVPSTVDRYYVPGPAGLAVISLSTPDGVDNVDAFREMIQSFKWT